MSLNITPVIYTAFAIRDIKTESFNMPYFQTHKAAAMRSFQDLASDPQAIICKHPADFQLFEIGTYNSQTGAMVPHDTPVYLATASDYHN